MPQVSDGRSANASLTWQRMSLLRKANLGATTIKRLHRRSDSLFLKALRPLDATLRDMVCQLRFIA